MPIKLPDQCCHPSREWIMARKPILLTFDDGPNPSSTLRILEVLAARSIVAVFFMVGKRLLNSDCRNTARTVAQLGHVVGNHTWHHTELTSLSNDCVREEILRAEDALGEFLTDFKLFRPPFGAMDERVRDLVMSLGYAPMLWNVDPLDWNSAY